MRRPSQQDRPRPARWLNRKKGRSRGRRSAGGRSLRRCVGGEKNELSQLLVTAMMGSCMELETTGSVEAIEEPTSHQGPRWVLLQGPQQVAGKGGIPAQWASRDLWEPGEARLKRSGASSARRASSRTGSRGSKLR